MESSSKKLVNVRVMELLFQTADLVERNHNGSFIDRAKSASDDEIMRSMELIYRYIINTKFTETHSASNVYVSPNYSHEMGQCLYPPLAGHTSMASYWHLAGSGYAPIGAPTQPSGRYEFGAGPLAQNYNMYYPPAGVGYESSYLNELLRGRGNSSVGRHQASVSGEQPYPGQLTSGRAEDNTARPGWRSEQMLTVGPRHQPQQHGFGNQSNTTWVTDNAPTQMVGQMMPYGAMRNNQISRAFNAPGQQIQGGFGNGRAEATGRINTDVDANEVFDTIEVVIKEEPDDGEDSEENYEEGFEIEEA